MHSLVDVEHRSVMAGGVGQSEILCWRWIALSVEWSSVRWAGKVRRGLVTGGPEGFLRSLAFALYAKGKY